MQGDNLYGGVVNDAALRSYVERVSGLHDERDTINEDIREVYKEAKDAGFNTTILRELVRESRMEPDARDNRYVILDAYRHALGLYADTPLGRAALEAAIAPKPRRPRGRPRKHDLEDAEPVGAA